MNAALPGTESPEATASDRAILVLINRGASRADDLSPETIREHLRAAGYRANLHAAPSPADFAERIVSEAPPGSRVIVAGGDGTLNAVLPALLARDIALGILPLGTGNDFARALGIPADPRAALELTRSKVTRRVDIGIANGRPFLNSVGLGLAPALQEDLDMQEKQRFGGLVYALAAARRWKSFPAFDVVLENGRGERLRAVAQLTVVNGVCYGGGMPIAPDATLDDGSLKLLAIPRPGRLSALVELLVRRIGFAEPLDTLTERESRVFRIRCEPPQQFTVDGEPGGKTPVEIVVRRAALEVIVGDDGATGP